MYLGKVKQLKGTSIKMEDIMPIELKEERTKILIPLLQEGNENAAQTLIEGHMRLALSIASKYVLYFPHKEQDIVGEAFLALTRAVYKAKNNLQEPFNITGYISSTVHSQISNFLKTDHTIRIPEYVISRDIPYVPKIVIDIDLDDYPIMSRSEVRDKLLDVIDTTDLTDLEHTVMVRIADGWKQVAIAEMLKLSTKTISVSYSCAVSKIREAHG